MSSSHKCRPGALAGREEGRCRDLFNAADVIEAAIDNATAKPTSRARDPGGVIGTRISVRPLPKPLQLGGTAAARGARPLDCHPADIPERA